MPPNTIKTLAPAKVNLYLKILNKRPDGYHNIQTVMQPISLYDELEFELTEKDITITCDKKELASTNNLAYKAATLLHQRHNPARGIHIHLKKRIPVAAGLGGGSSDAAAALQALNSLWNLNLTQARLLRLGVELGADVPFFIYRKAALAEGIGERLTPWPSLSCWIVLIKPHFSVSTVWAYQNMNMDINKEGLTKPENYINILQLNWAKNNLAAVAGSMHNDFEPLIARKYPLLNELKKQLLDSDSLGVLMSGSGPTVFGLYAQYTVAEIAFSRLKDFVQERGVVALVKAIG